MSDKYTPEQCDELLGDCGFTDHDDQAYVLTNEDLYKLINEIAKREAKPKQRMTPTAKNERLEMIVQMQVTVPQALALQAMFKHWNSLASMGSSRMIGFYADGDGNFKPKCQWHYSAPVPELTPELEQAAACKSDGNMTVDFDYDGVAWKLHELSEKASS